LLILDSVPAYWAPQVYPTHTPPDPRAIAALYRERLVSMWAALAGLRQPVRFVVGSDGSAAYCGFAAAGREHAAQVLELFRAVIPGARFRPTPVTVLQRNWAAPLCLEGIPGARPEFPPQAADRLLRSLDGRPFLLFTELWPVSAGWLSAAVRAVEQQLENVRFDQLRMGQDPQLEGVRQALDYNLARYHEAESAGCWQAFVSLMTGRSEDTRNAAETLRASWADGDVRRPPVRWMPYAGEKIWNALLHREVVEVAHLPLESHPGYRITAAGRLRTAPRVTPTASQVEITLGEIIDGDAGTGRTLSCPVHTLFEHVGIFGSVGRGKSTALKSLLAQAWGIHRIPFLLIEPSIKREFRALLGERWAHPLQLFAAGEEKCALRLNLLEPQGVPLPTHIGHLKALLLAAFAWVPPQQYILEQALRRVYEEHGFDIGTGANRRGSGESLWPTLSDLYDVVPQVVAEAGYDAQISRNLVAGLRTRLGTMVHGPLGRILNCGRSLPLDSVLSSPAVLEMALLGDDEQKCLLMGAVLMAVGEHRLTSGPCAQGHLLVVEEAHRLLRNTVTEQRDEIASARGQAVETFANFMAELRAFRQALVAVDQSPSLLHPSVLANSSLKIVFRLANADDLDLMARNLHLDGAQRERLAFAPTGTAVVLGGAMDGAYHLRFPEFPLPTVTPQALEAHNDRIRREYAQALSRHRFGGAEAGHVCPARRAPAAVDAVERCALETMLILAGGGEPGAAVTLAANRLRGIDPALACCVFQAAVDRALREKGIEGRLSLGHEDRLARLWCAWACGIAWGGASANELRKLGAAIQHATADWGMPPARRIPTRCHPGCRAWFEARRLARHIDVRRTPAAVLPEPAALCLRDALEMLEALHARK
jgi:hypothetical protein